MTRWLPGLAALAALACADPKGRRPDDSAAPDDTGTVDLDEPDEETEVLILGGGLAGMSAALEARALGASFLLLDRKDALGGVAPWTGGMMIFAGTPEQADAGVVDSPETLLGEWPTFTGGDPEDPWVQAFILDNVREVHDWIVDKGVSLHLIEAADGSSGTARRVHVPSDGGGDIVDGLLAGLEGEDLRLSHEALGLVLEEGVVVGARFRKLADGREGWIRARSTVVATGSFLRDLDRIHRCRPDLLGVDLLWGSGVGSDGSGHTMLEAVGATWDNPSAIGIYMHGVADPREGLENEELAAAPSRPEDIVWVGPDGRRFADENRVNSFEAAEQALDATGGRVWAVMDAPSWAELRLKDPYQATAWEVENPDVSPELLLKNGDAVEGPSLADLAALMEVDASALEEEISTFNAYARGEASDPWRESATRRPSPIETSPFYALRLGFSAAKAFGGIEVDEAGRVTNKAGRPIPGLFAAGELTGMAGGSLVGHLGFTGSFTAVLYSGRVAGAQAAVEALAD